MFRHPLAGIQLVKGTVEPSENPADAARRELFEESGLVSKQPLFFIGKNTRMVRGSNLVCLSPRSALQTKSMDPFRPR